MDTMVLSELSKARPDPRVLEWIAAQDNESLFLSVMTLGEIERGILKKRRTEPGKADRISAWLDAVVLQFDQRFLQVTPAISKRWGRLSIAASPQDVDLLIAATALVHGLTVVTRNTRHFEPTGVRLFNPYTA